MLVILCVLDGGAKVQRLQRLIAGVALIAVAICGVSLNVYAVEPKNNNQINTNKEYKVIDDDEKGNDSKIDKENNTNYDENYDTDDNNMTNASYENILSIDESKNNNIIVDATKLDPVIDPFNGVENWNPLIEGNDGKGYITDNGHTSSSAFLMRFATHNEEQKELVKDVVFNVNGRDYKAICTDENGWKMALFKIKDFGKVGAYKIKTSVILVTDETKQLKDMTIFVDEYAKPNNNKISVLGDSLSAYWGVTTNNPGDAVYNKDYFEFADMYYAKFARRHDFQVGNVNAIGGTTITWDGVTEDTYAHIGKNYNMTSDKRIKSLGNRGADAPSMIFFFGGLNDALAGYDKEGHYKVSYGDVNAPRMYGTTTNFTDAYFTSLMKMNFYYPDSRIVSVSPYACIGDFAYNLPLANYAYNSISHCANYFGGEVVDLRASDIVGSEDLYDGIHANITGMRKICQSIEKKLGLDSTFEEGFHEDSDGKTRYYDENGCLIRNKFVCDGTYTYFVQADGTAMTDRLTYHPDGKNIIYLDELGHEVFSDFHHVKMSISGEAVDDYCFFNVFGYMYTDVLTWDKEGQNLLYANPYGILEVGKWFQFSDTVKWADGSNCVGIAGGYGYANADATLMRNQYTYDWYGNFCYIQGNGVKL